MPHNFFSLSNVFDFGCLANLMKISSNVVSDMPMLSIPKWSIFDSTCWKNFSVSFDERLVGFESVPKLYSDLAPESEDRPESVVKRFGITKSGSFARLFLANVK
ncbi:hypothetical protein BpHYR1_020789 [Brachionus plicatilis]|uniref:Uncharacterized protein n=1 Tax=Brachionus plicatilis TaxID=10195 RepID=A0A3M7S7N8_BRAPC|nr:hypothetical protein BpHYR1_020789 [Brachionus plicatilis]